MTWLRFSLNFEFGPPDPGPPEQTGADSITERADQWRPIGFYPPSDPTRHPDEEMATRCHGKART